MKREFLMLAQKYDEQKHRANGFYASEKLDGIRCFYDGGITRGMTSDRVPWANNVKHGRFNTETICTGVWSRYGQPIMAPDWWLNDLPEMTLDGELTMGVGTWQALSSTIKQRVPDSRWKDVQYKVFGSPPLGVVFGDGKINSTNFRKVFSGIIGWLKGSELWEEKAILPFYKEYAHLKMAISERTYCSVLEQYQLPSDTSSSRAKIHEMLTRIEDQGGEGLILRAPTSSWTPCRTYDLLKVKSLQDMEGIVVGYTWAKGTDMEKSLTGEKTDKLLGLMGSIRLRLESGVEFDLSGFKDSERKMIVLEDTEPWIKGQDAAAFGVVHRGEAVVPWIGNPEFPRRSKVTFRYRELSDTGIPKEGRYFRKHEEI